MARRVEKGDIVMYKDQLHLVDRIETSSIGCREFYVLNIVDGCSTLAYRHQLSYPDVQTLDLEQMLGVDFGQDLSFDDEVKREPVDPEDNSVTIDGRADDGSTDQAADTVVEMTEPAAPTPRFKAVSEEDLVRLEAENTSKSTDRQTKWAVKILKGNNNHLFSKEY